MDENFAPVSISQEVATEAKAFNIEMTEQLRALPDPWSFPPAVTRERRLQGMGAFPLPTYSQNAQDLQIEGPHGSIQLRYFQADENSSKGVIAHFHGGGFVFGSASFQDPYLEAMSKNTGLDVISVDYRLAPEHPFPQGPDDCEAACRWLLNEGANTYGWNNFALAGESAGATLALGTALRLRDKHGLTPFKAMALTAGWYDIGLTPSARLWGEALLFPTTRDLKIYARHFLLGEESTYDPNVSPIYARLDGMPATFLSVGTEDPLLDDTCFIASRLKNVGVETSLEVYPHGCHMFQSFDLALAKLNTQRIDNFFRTKFGST
ncbi:Acetyl esterase [Pseudovibrio axinellae]|uniref:Acetyl esterase n=1 Tax=Pseudovibrio axinellae TaxID=989403 RepID=A0A165YKT7_9HYPH|nr:alpha/beta hydrolase [Pseudovibrio axinellae]KZL18931.1 Acetyl esterase [Pseudovibrio axinellae]SEP87300.1 Acetyl esterase/lipase [Pseudovibrio axinellae]